MNVLVACEESQEVCKAFRARGHLAFSCDIQDCSGGRPDWHIKGDVLPILGGFCIFQTQRGTWWEMPDQWDLIIAHPPCTYLTVSGNRWFNVEKYGAKAVERYRQREEAYHFFMAFVKADCYKIAIENPVGYMNTHYRKPDQIIQPYQFGHHARKGTCLWLKGLPLLEPTNIVDPGEVDKNGFTIGGALQMARDDNGKILPWNDSRTAKARSKTFSGIAAAMAEQWG